VCKRAHAFDDQDIPDSKQMLISKKLSGTLENNSEDTDTPSSEQ
jgi:hypothetical protein